ncbi:Zinc finger CCCH-type with G patch domain-containing protein [Pseudolycoriella hygida]|uniref:Zinc finger CCCH-type with G patch domain-containing protein n=1 Tax=Pseudolycoriella hygida TaxID=35572 RepID=A0A9Q0MPK0_9DIPT|nr:Zinc finger CCCH-type with G patch domain-containing protein [Pseudolycoriella hygida]
MSKDDLLLSINEYRNQLTQVETAISSCTDLSQINSLKNLKNDLTELLDLTTEQLNELDNDEPTDPFDDEMKLFLAEIHDVDRSDNVDNNFDSKLEAIKNELNAIVGKKYLAPHTHSWGSKAFHNAFVCGLDDKTEYENNIDLDNIKVKVLFTNPTHRDMVPCVYFLDGNCKFDSDKCHFSHGELVLYNELKEYKEPDFQMLERVKCPVLAKQNDRIWYRGRIVSSNFNEKTCVVKLEQNNKEVTCEFPDVLPIQCDTEEESSDSDNSDEEFDNLRKQMLVERTLLNPSSNQVLGEWEKHTKGFGSKIMQKFGYVVGTGLGNNGEGIVAPIQIQVLPSGKSLDHCMELREKANGDKDLFSVERKWKKQQKKQEEINMRAYEREQHSNNVFNFLNDIASLAGCSDRTETQFHKPQTEKKDFKSHSTKNLNVAGFQIAEDIKKLEKDIQSVQNSMARQQRGSIIYNKLSGQLNLKNAELNNLKKSERNVKTEQVFRKDKCKLTIF